MLGKKTKDKKSADVKVSTDKEEKEIKEISELRSQLARTLADYDNLAKRTDREREEFAKFASLGVIIKLLPVLDNLENAQEHLKDQGLAISIGEFKKVLNEEDLIEINPVAGEDFNEHLHEAVEIIKIDKDLDKKGKVGEVVLKGWKFKDGRVVRYAKVKVFGELNREPEKEVVN